MVFINSRNAIADNNGYIRSIKGSSHIKLNYVNNKTEPRTVIFMKLQMNLSTIKYTSEFILISKR
jgi:hypothetical protein